MTDRASGLRWPKAVGLSAAYLVGGLLLTGLLVYGASYAIGPAVLSADAAGSLLLQGVLELAAFAFLTWLIGRRLLRMGWDELRVRVPGAGRGFVGGLVLATGLALLALVVAVPAAGARWSPDAGGVGAYVQSVVGVLAVLAPAALAEEVIFRGLPVVLLARVFGRGPAIVALAVVFGLVHGANPSVTPLAIGNIALAGVFLGLAFFAPGGLWTAWGAHLGWNATIAAADAPVSGLPFTIPLIDYDPGAPAWLSGGAFGPEGGVLATVVLLLGCFLLGQQLRKDEPA
ncbi:MAG TPA: CPBP family intramembrane glutamic endopeptidase [Gemmatimonadales bacterium]|nr:CPBP family intramembrane glutamic endopeptidase [Gemmatimonadales bacterium]